MVKTPIEAPDHATGEGTDPPRILDRRYRLEHRRTEGAYGVVYEAFHLGLKRRVAIKLLPAHPDESAAERFRREAEALGRLEHPHVVRVFDSGLDTESGRPYLVMELLLGESLADRLARRGGLAPKEALPLLAAVAAAVDEAHRLGILHRDLKPANILVVPGGSGAAGVKVLDFGLAKLVAEATGAADVPALLEPATNPEVSTSWGTPLYAAPELFRGKPASRSSDLYALAVLAYESLAGHPPFQGSLAAVIEFHHEAEPPASAALSPEVLAELRRAMSKRPEDRPATARDLVRDLAGALNRPILRERSRSRRERLKRSGIALGLGLALLAPFSGRLSIPPAERFLFDLAASFVPARPPDGRLLLVTLDDNPGASPGRSLAERGDEIAAGSLRLLAAGARGIAFDLLLPESWSRSAGFVRLAAGHPDALVLAAHSTSEGEVIGTEAASGLLAAALGPAGAASLFGFVNVDEDPDGKVRKGRLAFQDASGTSTPSWALRVAERLGAPVRDREKTFWIDPGLEGAEYPALTWTGALRRLNDEPGHFRGRLVLIGAGTRAAGDDVHRVPGRFGATRPIAGLVLEARMADTIATGLPLRDPPAGAVAVAAFLLGGAAGFAVLRARRFRAALGFVVVLCGSWLGVSVFAFLAAGRVVPVTPALLVAGIATLAAAIRRRGSSSRQTEKELFSIP